jgi:hypothetical protein
MKLRNPVVFYIKLKILSRESQTQFNWWVLLHKSIYERDSLIKGKNSAYVKYLDLNILNSLYNNIKIKNLFSVCFEYVRHLST